MKNLKITIVRVYITEASKLLNEILDYLQDEVKIRGITVFRAISGYGESGKHTSSLLELSLDLPLVIEFFDDREKIKTIIQHLHSFLKPKHIVFWDANSS